MSTVVEIFECRSVFEAMARGTCELIIRVAAKCLRSWTRKLLGEDGLLTGDDEAEGVDIAAAEPERWDRELLVAADDRLKGWIAGLTLPAPSVQVTMLGPHPRADGAVRGPRAGELVMRQIHLVAGAAGLLA